MKDYGFNTSVSDGSDQGQREPLAFRAGYFNVDEMTFEVLLSMASEYAATINYYNVANQKEGSWAALFNSNEAVIMALIATSDVQSIESGFTRLGMSELTEPAAYVIGVAAKLDFWLQRLTVAPTASAAQLRSNIHDMIGANLLPGLHTAAEVMLRSDSADASVAMADVSHLSTVWGATTAEGQYTFRHAAEVDLDNHEAVVEQLGAALLKMTASIRYLKTLVADMLEHSLQSESHEPAIGLFMVFLRLYEVAQQRLNRFSARHLDFYYRDCLNTAPRGRQSESLFLKFEPAAATGEFLVDREIAFSADKNRSAGERLHYLTTPLLVRRASVNALQTLFLQRNLLVSPECELGHVTRIKAYKRSQSATESPSTVEPMPLFGSAKRGMKLNGLADAEIGFCVASPLLALKEGRREIELSIDFSMPDAASVDAEFNDVNSVNSCETFKKWFGKIFSYYLLSGESFLNDQRHSRLVELVTEYGGDDGVCLSLLKRSWQDLFYRLFSRPFAITLSGESGWLEVKEYLVAPAIEDDGGVNSGLKISLSLGHDVEAVMSYDAEVHGGNRNCSVPMINVCLDPEASFFAYSLLNSVTIKSVEVEVAVKGVKDVVITNHLGRVDPTKPFTPFGPLPTRHSYIVMGSREAASKQLTAMELEIEWGELPTLSGGFSSHYQDYDFIPLNSDFKAEISVLQNGHWMPSKTEAQYRVAMFGSGRGGVVSEKSLLEVGAVDYFKPLDAADINERYEYRSGVRNGFLRLQMSSPENAFGHADYPLLLTRILSENARRKKPLAVPNAPYTPTIKQLSLNYKARTLIRPGIDLSFDRPPLDERLFHIHPFGIEQTYPSKIKGSMRLFPQYEDDGNLFVGITAQNLSGPLTLFFNLDEDVSRACLLQRPAIHWSCLTASGWLLLEDHRVLSDTTEGFLMSGVVTLDLPAGMICDSTLMPQGQYWLRVSVTSGAEDFSGLRSIFTNVGLLKCSTPEVDNNEESGGIAVDANWRPLKSVPGLAAVSSIGPVTGGGAAEDERRYRTRVSERLRHKGRATSAWDYEHLILERFPDVHKVKCFANNLAMSWL